MKYMYSAPIVVLIVCVSLVAGLAPIKIDTAKDWLRVFCIGVSLAAAIGTFIIFWNTRKGWDKVPPMLFGVLLLGGCIGNYQYLGQPEDFHWYGTPLRIVVSLIFIVFTIVKYGDLSYKDKWIARDKDKYR